MAKHGRKREYQCPSDWEIDATKATWTAKEKENLKKWLQDMVDWSTDVRDDLIRVEAAARLHGDPGDPPPPPE